MMKLDTLNKTNNMKEWVQNISTTEYFRMYDKICLTSFDQNNFHTFKNIRHFDNILVIYFRNIISKEI